MTATIIDGKAVALAIHEEVRREAEELRAGGCTPGLAVVLVGSDPASVSYVTAKQRACEEDRIESFGHSLPGDSTQDRVLGLLAELRADDRVDGILVQLPLPRHLDEKVILDAVPVQKDVDGFHAENLGKLGLRDAEARFAPCTPAGVIELLKRTDVAIDGAHAVVLGRSKIVGLPAALLLLRENATVTICHSRTRDIAEHLRRADIIVAAIGKPDFVTGDMVREGAVVIDVGVNRVDDSSKKSGFRLVGDCHFDSVAAKARAITPVPGGVGPMTIAMLMKNTVRAARARLA